MDQDLDVDSRPIESIANGKPTPMKRTKKPKPQRVKPIEPETISGPKNKREARIARRKSGIDGIRQKANAPGNPTMGASF